MSDFETQEEILRWILDGDTVLDSSGNPYFLEKGHIVVAVDGKSMTYSGGFSDPERWQKLIPKQSWYRRKWVMWEHAADDNPMWHMSKERFDLEYKACTNMSEEWEERTFP